MDVPAGVARRVRGLAVAGIAGLLAQQLALVVALRLAAHGEEGSIVVFQVATAVFVLPWAVLAVPIATTVFARLSASADVGEDEAYADLASKSLTAVLMAMLGGAAVLVAVARPAAELLAAGVPGPDNVSALAHAVAAFAPGLLGYGLLALLGRALYARGDGRAVAAATVTGWIVVAGLDVVLVSTTHLDRVVALGAGNSAGMSVAGLVLVLSLRRAAPAALHGCGATAAVSLVAALVAVVIAGVVPRAHDSAAATILSGLLLAAIAAGVFLGLVRLLRPAALRVLRDV